MPGIIKKTILTIDGLPAVAEQIIQLPSGGSVSVPVARPKLAPSAFPNIWGYGKKPIVQQESVSRFAEIAILELLRRDGWQGVWVDSWKGRFLSAMPGERGSVVSLDALEHILPLRPFIAGFRTFGGAWDVLAWRGDQILFCDAKWSKKDSIRPNQVEWLQQRLAEGASADNFLIAEWTMADDPPLLAKFQGSRKFKLVPSTWYGWHMFPGYTGVPYSSPIRLQSFGPAIGEARLGLQFINIGYASGVQDSSIDLDITVWDDSFVAGTYPAEPRLGVITELTAQWLATNVPDLHRELALLGEAKTPSKVASIMDKWLSGDSKSK